VIGSAKKRALFLTTKCFSEKNAIIFMLTTKIADNQTHKEKTFF